jgi:hypothetical protein
MSGAGTGRGALLTAQINRQQEIGKVNFLPKHSAIIKASGGLGISLRSQLHPNLTYENIIKNYLLVSAIIITAYLF